MEEVVGGGLEGLGAAPYRKVGAVPGLAPFVVQGEVLQLLAHRGNHRRVSGQVTVERRRAAALRADEEKVRKRPEALCGPPQGDPRLQYDPVPRRAGQG